MKYFPLDVKQPIINQYFGTHTQKQKQKTTECSKHTFIFD